MRWISPNENGRAKPRAATTAPYTFGPVDGGQTRMTLRNRGEPAGFAKFTSPLRASAMRRANEKDLACIKRLFEST